MTSAHQKIVIAGAGIGGLCAALSLARTGKSVAIYERRSDQYEAGAGIQLGPNATGVLWKLGVLDAVRAFAAEPDGLTIHDGVSGRTLARFPLGAWMRERHGAPYLTLHRQDLHRALRLAVQSDANIALSYGKAVTAFENRGGAVDVCFADGTRQSADALIAADGLWSVLREKVSGSDAPQPTSKCAYRAVVSRAALQSSLSNNDVHVWLAPNAHVVHYPAGQAGDVAIVVVLDGDGATDGWDRTVPDGSFHTDVLAKLAQPLRDLIGSVDTWRMWRLQRPKPVRRWVDGAVALLGDAAHPVMPFFAQGAGLAIEDGAVLAQSIARAGSIADCLSAYESARRDRAQRVLDASTNNGRIYHLAGPAAAARNAVLMSVPGALMMRRYDWLYGWRP